MSEHTHRFTARKIKGFVGAFDTIVLDISDSDEHRHGIKLYGSCSCGLSKPMYDYLKAKAKAKANG